jgi:hypothetical protein
VARWILDLNTVRSIQHSRNSLPACFVQVKGCSCTLQRRALRRTFIRGFGPFTDRLPSSLTWHLPWAEGCSRVHSSAAANERDQGRDQDTAGASRSPSRAPDVLRGTANGRCRDTARLRHVAGRSATTPVTPEVLATRGKEVPASTARRASASSADRTNASGTAAAEVPVSDAARPSARTSRSSRQTSGDPRSGRTAIGGGRRGEVRVIVD